VLREKRTSHLKEFLSQTANEIGVSIEEVEVLEDHVHLYVKAKPSAAPHWTVQQLKEYTSRLLRQEDAESESKLPTLWARSCYCESVGHLSETSIRK
jgi:putative transposase